MTAPPLGCAALPADSAVRLAVPDAVAAAARQAPGQPIALVDPCWPGDGPPPGWAVLGHWHSDPDGAVVKFQENPEYRPSPLMLEWPHPTDPVDAAMQLAATGYGEADEVVRLLAGAEVAVLALADKGAVRACAPDSTPVVPVFTAQTHLEPVGRLGYRVLTVAELVGQVPSGHDLYLNPTGPVAILISVDAVGAALAALGPTP